MALSLDITGTMLISSLFFVFGVKGFRVEQRGGAALVLVFMMILVGKWHRRSGAMSIAEWMEFRFGSGRHGSAARMLSTLSLLFDTIGIIGFFLSTLANFSHFFCRFRRSCARLA